MAKIVVLKPHPKWAYDLGQEGVVPDKAAKKMIEAGYWKQLDEPKQTNNNDKSSSKRTKPSGRKSVSKD